MNQHAGEHAAQHELDRVYFISQEQKRGRRADGDGWRIHEGSLGALNHNDGHQGQRGSVYAIQECACGRRASQTRDERTAKYEGRQKEGQIWTPII